LDLTGLPLIDTHTHFLQEKEQPEPRDGANSVLAFVLHRKRVGVRSRLLDVKNF